ncbi:FK506-binding protein 5-like [Cloeon dipterum]|uniref:FK506-binding protein 5-like n=1 Tax=Cloeon dipterum TaxID=197152 RepID=UPI0032204389
MELRLIFHFLGVLIYLTEKCRLEETTTAKSKPISFVSALNSTSNMTAETNRKLQKIANITIAQFLNNQTRHNYSISELLELKELADSIMGPESIIPDFVKKSNAHLITLPSVTMINLASAILKSDFMPVTIMQPTTHRKTNEKLEKKKGETEEKITNATMDEALATMNYHRKMMNEFLCRNYVAESILDALEKDASIFTDYDTNEFSERMGESEPEIAAEMIADLGSTRYQDWLERSTALTDVYKSLGGFEPNPYIVRPISPSDLPIIEERKKYKDEEDDEDDEEDDDDDEDEKKRKKPSKKKKKKKKKKPKPDAADAIEEEEEVEEEDDDHDAEAGDDILQVVDTHVLHGGQPYEDSDPGWNIFRFGFVDFYDSALTAIAFLTFGIFTLQVFINLITNANAPKTGILVNNSTSAPPVNKKRSLSLEQIKIIEATEQLPRSITESPSTTETPTFELVFGVSVTPSIDLEPVREEPPVQRYIGPEEVVAKFALVTIRAALNKDEPRCLHAALCRANRASLQLEGPPRLWLPMWSVAMSWLAQRAGGIPGSQEMIAGALENLRASVLGLGGVKCEVVYPPCLH